MNENENTRISSRRFRWRCASRALLLATGLCLFPVGPLRADGTVGTGDAASCTEASFDAALVGGGVVDFDCGGPATIVFTSAKTITADTTINGAPGIVLSGGSSVNLFEVNGGDLEINSLTLADGRDSVAAPGSAAIDADGQTVTIRDSVVRGHLTSEGGCPAISVTDGTLVIERSTIHGNTNQAAASGHPICINVGSTAEITNSTLTDNTGGSFFGSGTATFSNSTVAENRSTGIGNTGGPTAFSSGTITLINTLVADNENGQCAEPAGGTIVDGGGNFQFPDDDCGMTIPVADPALATLADNGGPTLTMAVAFPSVAVDSAQQLNCPATDQRGQMAADGDGNGSVLCDVGAFEAAEVGLVAVPTSSVVARMLLLVFLSLAGWRVLRS